MAKQLQKTFQLKKGYIRRTVGATEVLLSVGDNIADFNGYIELNSSAALLLHLLQQPQSSGMLEQALEERFCVSHRQAREDVEGFLRDLEAHDMVVMNCIR